MSKLNVNLTQKKLSVNINKTGPKGDTGDSAYVYVAYASDDQGTGFSLTASESLDYIAILSTDTEIASPSAGDFDGLWVRYQTADPDATETLTNKTITALSNTVYADQVHKAGDNETGISLDKAKAVFASDYNTGQDETEIELADASDDTKMPSIGLTFESIDTGSVGAIARMGAIEGVDTSAYPVGTVLYVSETAGEITDTPPSSAGSWVQPIAYVMRSNAGNGVLAVLENIAYKITPTADGDIASKKYVDDEKLNKNITNGAENDLLTLESGVWVNKAFNDYNEKNSFDNSDSIPSQESDGSLVRVAWENAKQGFVANEENVFAPSDIDITGFMRPDGTTSTNSSYLRSDLLPINGVQKLYIYSRVLSTSVSPAVFFDSDENYISGYTATETALTLHEVDVPSNARYFVTSMLNSSAPTFYANYDIFVANSSAFTRKDEVYISPSGDDDTGDGTESSPYATIVKALKKVKLDGEIVALEGDYEGIEIPSMGGVKLRGQTGKTVRFIYGIQKIESASLESGYTKVYRVDGVTLNANTVNLFQHDINDSNTSINQADRFSKHGDRTHRLTSTKIIEASDLNDIENSSELKYLESGGDLYFSKSSGSDLSVNPIYEPNYTTQNITIDDIEIENIQILYEPFFTGNDVTIKARFKNVSVLFPNRTCFYLSGESIVELINCEGAGSKNDGVGIHQQAKVTEVNCWMHDNDDEGSSAHSSSIVKRIGGLYEANGTHGVHDVNSSSTHLQECISKDNTTSAYNSTFAETDGNDYGNQTLINCVGYGNVVSNEANRVKAYNTLLIDGTMDADVDDFNTTVETT